MTLGIREILHEWIKFRVKCLSRELTFTLNKKKDKLHLLQGLAKLLVDIDKAIKIIRGTENEDDVVPNLAKAFDISTVQAEYIAEIKLRHLNREYIINRMKEFDQLEKDIKELTDILKDELKVKELVMDKDKRTVTIKGVEIELTAKEFDILLLLITNPGKVYRREDLLELIWKDYSGDIRTVDVHIRRLREKIERDNNKPEFILTKWKVGYYFTDKD
jgi:DNA-binding response OmpR family regulator